LIWKSIIKLKTRNDRSIPYPTPTAKARICYSPQAFLLLCEIKAVGCTGIAQGLQHKIKRSSKNLLDRKNLLRSCNNCNTWIENNPLEAIAMGVSASKFKEEEK
jgi:hypothetical protein